MRSYLSEILDLLGEQRSRLPGLMSLFLLASLLDLAGIGLIGPYIAFVLGTNVIESELNQIGSYLGIPAERQPMLIFLSLVLIGIFLIKTASAIWINRKIIIPGFKIVKIILNYVTLCSQCDNKVIISII